MDWIEKLIGLSPDGGDGTAEAAIVFACVIVFGAIAATRVPFLGERLRASFKRWRTR
jgi:hypothetical protein